MLHIVFTNECLLLFKTLNLTFSTHVMAVIKDNGLSKDFKIIQIHI